jgi:hypothetical protein
MDDNRFFKFIWRVNALAIALLLMIAVCAMAWEMGLRKVFAPRDVSQVVNIDTTDQSLVQKRQISAPTKLEGHDLFLVSVNSEQQYDTEYSSKGTRNTRRNIGIYDPKSGTIKWVFPTQDQLITEVTTLFVEQSKPSGQTVSVADSLLITFVDNDTNGDKRLSNSDVKSLHARKILEAEGKTVLTNIDSDPRVWGLKGKQRVLFFKRDGVLQSALFDSDTMTIDSTHAIKLP